MGWHHGHGFALQAKGMAKIYYGNKLDQNGLDVSMMGVKTYISIPVENLNGWVQNQLILSFGPTEPKGQQKAFTLVEASFRS